MKLSEEVTGRTVGDVDFGRRIFFLKLASPNHPVRTSDQLLQQSKAVLQPVA
jgi:hypothetical protein